VVSREVSRLVLRRVSLVVVLLVLLVLLAAGPFLH
jgi:hypothetical protein